MGSQAPGRARPRPHFGADFPSSRVFLESEPAHPLLLGAPDTRHKVHSAESFAAAALEKLEDFLASAEGGTPYVFQSHLTQSTVRVLLQCEALT